MNARLADVLAGTVPELDAEHLVKGLLAFLIGYVLGWLITAELAVTVRLLRALG